MNVVLYPFDIVKYNTSVIKLTTCTKTSPYKYQSVIQSITEYLLHVTEDEPAQTR